MPTNLTFHMSANFATYITTGLPPTIPNQGGTWVYLYLNSPPQNGTGAEPNFVTLISGGNLGPSVVNTGTDYIVNVDLTTSQTPTVKGGVVYLLVQSENPTGHHDLTTLITSEGLIQKNISNWNYGYSAFEYSLLNGKGDQGDLTYIDGFGPHLAVKINGDSRGFQTSASSFQGTLNSPSTAIYKYPASTTGTPFSQLDSTQSMAISPSNGTFGAGAYPPTAWDTYVNTVVTQQMTFSGSTGGSPDASSIWHNGSYFSYTVYRAQTVSDPTTNYLLFVPTTTPGTNSINSQTQGYILLKQTDAEANLYAPGQGTALAKMYSTMVLTNGLFDDTKSTPYIIPGSSAPPGSTPTTNQFNVSANNEWGNALTQFFTGFTAGYWGTAANQANPANVYNPSDNLAPVVSLNSSVNWGPAYAFDSNRVAGTTPGYQHNDQYSYKYYLPTNVYASAFSDNLAQGLSVGPQIGLWGGSANVSQIDLYTYAPTETDQFYKQPSGVNYLSGSYLVPTTIAPPGTNSLVLQMQVNNLSARLANTVTAYLGIYEGQDGNGHAMFSYVQLPAYQNGSFQNINLSATASGWAATATGASANGNFIQINNLPTSATTPTSGQIYWYQVLLAQGAVQKMFDIYATVDGSGNFQLFNPAAGNGTANNPLAATDGNAQVTVNNSHQISFSLMPDASLPASLLSLGFNSNLANPAGTPITEFAAPVIGTMVSSTFAPVAGQTGTGVDVAHGYTQVQIPGQPTGTYYSNTLPALTLTSGSGLYFGWTGTNNVARDDTNLILPTMPVFGPAPTTPLVVAGQVSEFTNKVMPYDTALVQVYNGNTVVAQASGVSDLDGQWTTGALSALGNGTYTAVMTEVGPGGNQISTFNSAPLTFTVNAPSMSLGAPAGGFLKLDPAGGGTGSWVQLSTDGSNLPNGTLLVYATDTGGHMLARDGSITTDIQQAVLAQIGSVAFDNGTTMLNGQQSVYLPAGQQMHFAVQTGDNTINLVPGVVVGAGTGSSQSVHVNTDGGTLSLSAHVDNTLTTSQSLANAQRQYDQPWMYLSQGEAVHVDVAGSAWNVNTVHFVHIDVNATTGAWSVGGIAYGNTDAFRGAVQANWDPGFQATGGHGSFQTATNWTTSTGTGFYAPVMQTAGGDTFVIGTANVDGRSHIRTYGGNTFGFEDLRADQHSDFDYNDLVMHVSVL